MIALQYALVADSTIQCLGIGTTAAASLEPVHDVSGAGDMVQDMVTDQSDFDSSCEREERLPASFRSQFSGDLYRMSVERSMKRNVALRTTAAIDMELAVTLANEIDPRKYQAVMANLKHVCQRPHLLQVGDGFRLEFGREKIWVFWGCCMECHIRAATMRTCASPTYRLQ